MTHQNASPGPEWPFTAISGYPDATFSLRFTYGTIDGWTEGRTDHFAIHQFRRSLSPCDRAAAVSAGARAGSSDRDRLDPNTVFNMSSDNDIIGGNSGSPLLNARAEVIGAIFDGNIHSLGGTYFFDPKLNRAVSVSTAAMTEALNKVYGQQRLVAELTAP